MSLSKKLLTLAAMVFAGASLVAHAADKKEVAETKVDYGKQKVVYHVNDIDSANGALRNVKNHLNALGDDNIEIIVVTHGGGAFSLVDGSKDAKGNQFEETVQSLANRGVKFQICANTIRGKKIDKSKINLNAEIVPSGVAQVAYLQSKGYLYVKP